VGRRQNTGHDIKLRPIGNKIRARSMPIAKIDGRDRTH